MRWPYGPPVPLVFDVTCHCLLRILAAGMFFQPRPRRWIGATLLYICWEMGIWQIDVMFSTYGITYNRLGPSQPLHGASLLAKTVLYLAVEAFIMQICVRRSILPNWTVNCAWASHFAYIGLSHVYMTNKSRACFHIAHIGNFLKVMPVIIGCCMVRDKSAE
eukprot:gnl/TRDRNA2_/TRDRNA2_154217_c0_seq1.p1 gnl/TRDRNA2_/TRDRNA2_154217_c0~~gnl/TRDRNA2_/TRDRNA2_154217_c0_seq1.p1  ORF type:complete len:162 (+),score=14.10 gnl/TRDRNA2_/TRDRNA2_154217_c0_seq1:259-744(+)